MIAVEAHPFGCAAHGLATMVQVNGQEPILVAGGGIGGLAAAYALARQGFAVRVFEQAPEFKELGAGIQLGPNIFRALDKIGLKDAVLADAHRPPGDGDALRALGRPGHAHSARRSASSSASSIPMR